MGRQLRLLRYQGNVGIDELETLAAHHPQHAQQEFGAGNTFITGIAVGKVRADVAVAQRAEYRVYQRMQYGIGVGVTGKPAIMLNLDAGQYQLAPAAQPMDVEPMSYAKFSSHDLGTYPPCLCIFTRTDARFNNAAAGFAAARPGRRRFWS